MRAIDARLRPVALAGALLALVFPNAAQAHGPLAPVATSYLASIVRVPSGLHAKVVDGYLRLWLKTPSDETVIVLDYRGAPYLRFSRSGVFVNTNSEMYYLDYLVPLNPPLGLTRGTPPHWKRVSEGHEFNWHDARLGALSQVAVAPGADYLGRWSIPVLVNGRLLAISGGLRRANAPSLVWFWPIAVLIACLLAALRLRRRALDARLARVLAIAALLAGMVGVTGWGLHGRPQLELDQLVVMGVGLAFATWALTRVLRSRHGVILLFAISFAALLIGDQLAGTLLHGFVLIALPALIARVTAVLCLSGGAGLLLVAIRLANQE
jgi:hypothetical protein